MDGKDKIILVLMIGFVLVMVAATALAAQPKPQDGFCLGVATALETDDYYISYDQCFVSIDQGESWLLYVYEKP